MYRVEIVIVVVVVLFILYNRLYSQKESFMSDAKKQEVAINIHAQKKIFDEGPTLKKLKSEVPEVDAVVYEDVTKLHKIGGFNVDNIRNVL